MYSARGVVRLIGFILLQLLIVLTLLEIVARVFDPFGISYFPENARFREALILEEPIGYRLRPGLEDRYHGVPVRINRLGLRDRDVEGKVPGEYRILAMGDSVPFGIGSRYEDSYPHQLDVLLNERHPGKHFRVINTGVPSYNTEQELIQLKTLGLSLQPDAVTLLFSANDINPKLWSMKNKHLIEHSYAGSLLQMLVGKVLARVSKRGDSSRAGVALDEYRLDSPRWQAIDRSLTEIQAILRARRIPFVLFATIRHQSVLEMVDKVARREGIIFINLQRKDDPRWAGLEERLFHNSVVDGHPSALGNRVLATVMAENLERYRALGKR